MAGRQELTVYDGCRRSDNNEPAKKTSRMKSARRGRTPKGKGGGIHRRKVRTSSQTDSAADAKKMEERDGEATHKKDGQEDGLGRRR